MNFAFSKAKNVDDAGHQRGFLTPKKAKYMLKLFIDKFVLLLIFFKIKIEGITRNGIPFIHWNTFEVQAQ